MVGLARIVPGLVPTLAITPMMFATAPGADVLLLA
jgi:hypothetical protein